MLVIDMFLPSNHNMVIVLLECFAAMCLELYMHVYTSYACV